jgi:transposase
MAVKTPTQPEFKVKNQYGAGLDIHNQYVTAAIVVKRNISMDRMKVQEFKRSPEGLGNMCRFLGKHLISIIVMEATGHTPSVLDFLESYDGWKGIVPELVVINPSLLKKYPGELHQDKHDAVALGELGLAGLAKGSYIPLDSLRMLRALTREVSNVIKDTTRIKNRIKRIFSHWGLPLKKFSLDAGWATDMVKLFIANEGDFGYTIKSMLDGTVKVSKTTFGAIKRREAQYEQYYPVILPKSIVKSMQLYMLELSFNAAILDRLSTEIETFVNEHPFILRQVRLIQEIPGLSEKSAAAIIAEVGNVDRFPNVRPFLKYVGCSSSQFQSGNLDYKGKLSVRVNHYARNLFITAGRVLNTSVRKDSDLKEYARKMTNSHFGEKKLIFTNSGIKIAKTVFGVLRSGKKYDPFFESKRKQEISGKPPKKVKIFKMRQLRRKTKALVKYLDDTLQDAAEPWYSELSSYFNEIKRSKVEES